MNDKKHNDQLLSQKAEDLLKSYSPETLYDEKEAWNRLVKKIEQQEPKPVRRIPRYFTVAASVAATIAVLVTFWLFTATQTVHSNQGESYAFRLPDDSRVVLHDGSVLAYNRYFWNRKVNLTGEAYFEVEKGAGFFVKTKQGEVEVLGTRFLVNELDNQFTVQCYEGRVKTSYKSDSWLLEPGTRFSGRGDAGEKETVLNENGYPAFARFSGKFQDVPLMEVVKEIERFFDVDIDLKTTATKHFSGAIQTGNLENVLQIVCAPLQLDYAFEDKYRIIIY